MSVIKRAGIIPYTFYRPPTRDPDDPPDIVMLFMKPSDPAYGGECFQIAKGRFDSDTDTSQQVALREGHEELGLKSDNVENLTFLASSHGVDYFIGYVKDKDDFDQFGFETKETTWLTNNQFQQIGRDIHKRLVDEAHSIIMYGW